MANLRQTILTWFLVASQVLVGNGGSLYVCVHADGSFCGIGVTPDGCRGCESQFDRSATDSCCNQCVEPSAVTGSADSDDGELVSATCQNGDCNCTQLQVATGEWTIVSRGHTDDSFSSGHSSVLFAILLEADCVRFPAIDDELNPTDKLQSQNDQLIELSCIMLRC